MWRWSQQYQAQLTGHALPDMVQLIDWLKNHIPADDSDPSVGRVKSCLQVIVDPSPWPIFASFPFFPFSGEKERLFFLGCSVAGCQDN